MLSATSSVVRCSVRSFASVPRLDGKIAVITGASAGIGRETALKFAREGAKGIVLADMNEAGLQETAHILAKEGFKAIPIKTNVASSDDCKRMVDLAEKEFGGLHVVFNNAGIMDSNDDDAVSTSEKVFDLT